MEKPHENAKITYYQRIFLCWPVHILKLSYLHPLVSVENNVSVENIAKANKPAKVENFKTAVTKAVGIYSDGLKR